MQAKNREIEILRGVAVLMVLWDHLGILFYWGEPTITRLWSAIPGWGGVDLFFCISGYVIARSINTHHGSSAHVSFIQFALPFWVRRAWRLIPSAWLWLIVTFVFSLFWNRSGAFVNPAANIGDAISVLFQVSNLHFFDCYHTGKHTCGANGVYWSLSLEEQFYLLFPFVTFFFGKKWRVAILIAAIAAQFFIHRPIWSLAWAIRTDAVCMGVLIAMAQDLRNYRLCDPVFMKNKAAAVCVPAMSLVLIAALPGEGIFVASFDTGLIALCGAFLIFIASFSNNYILPVPYLSEFFEWVGARSYAIYLAHLPCFHIAIEIWCRTLHPWQQLDSSYAVRIAVTAFSLLIVCAELNYRLVEIPGKRYGARLASKLAGLKSDQSDAPGSGDGSRGAIKGSMAA